MKYGVILILVSVVIIVEGFILLDRFADAISLDTFFIKSVPYMFLLWIGYFSVIIGLYLVGKRLLRTRRLV